MLGIAGGGRVRPELQVAAYAVCVHDDKLLVARFIGHGHQQWTLCPPTVSTVEGRLG